MRNSDAAAAFQALYDETRRQALTYLTARCGDPADAADLFQETYAEAYAALCRRGPGYVRHGWGFVQKLARQQLHRHYRRRDLRPEVPLEEIADACPAPEAEIDDRLVTEELLASAHDALAREPALTRKIFALHISLGLTLAETARELGVSESFVKNRLYRAMARLRRACGI